MANVASTGSKTRRSPNTGSVIQRSDGRLAVTLPSDLDPSRRVLYGPGRRVPWASREQAEAWLNNEVARLRAPPAVASSGEPLGAYLARWFEIHEQEWSERTRLAYARALRRWRAIGGVPLATLTRETVQTALAELQRATWQRTRRDGTPTSEPRPYARRTLQLSRTVLHAALEDLVPDILASNPARLRRRSQPVPAADAPVWSAEQAEAFLATAERHAPHLALLYRLILRRALRIGEAVALTWADVDASAGTLRIDETPGLRRGTSGPTKTRRTRDVPLSADLLARIRAHRRDWPATDPHLFTLNGRWISTAYALSWWHRIVRVARLPTITPRDGRATCATLLLDAGMPLPEISRLLGHSNIAVTAKHYARRLEATRARTAQLGEHMDELLNETVRDADSG